MEEDIKILEEWLIQLNELFEKTKINNTKERKSLENLIKGYREKEEKLNKLLKYEDDLRIRERAFCKENHIPKSKIKEKIEELESKIKATFCKYMTEEDYYNNKFLSSDVAEDYEVLEVRKLISNRNLLQELMEE